MITGIDRGNSGSSIIQVLVLLGVLSILILISAGEISRNFRQAKTVQSMVQRKRFESLFSRNFLENGACSTSLVGLTMDPRAKTVHNLSGLISVFQNMLVGTTWAGTHSVNGVALEIDPNPNPDRSYYSTIKVSIKVNNSNVPSVKKMELKFFLLTDSPNVTSKTIIACQTDNQLACEQVGGVFQNNPSPACIRPAQI